MCECETYSPTHTRHQPFHLSPVLLQLLPSYLSILKFANLLLFPYLWGALHCNYGANIDDNFQPRKQIGDYFQPMATILDRIQEIAQNEGISIGALERQIGASKGVLSRAINNGTDIQSKWIQTLVENYPLYSAEWLLTGRGVMHKTNCAQSSKTPSKATPALNEDTEKNSTKQVDISAHGEVIDRLVAQITQQAEEIGRLRERIAQLEREQQKNASGAAGGKIANAG